MIPTPDSVERPWLPHLVPTLGGERIFFKAGGSIPRDELAKVSAVLWKTAQVVGKAYHALVEQWVKDNGTRFHLHTK